MAWGDQASLGSGLPDRFQATITSSRVKYPYEKNQSQSAVVIDFERRIDDEVEDDHLWLKAGTQFDAGDAEGTFLLHQKQTPEVFDDPSSKKNKINKNSAYGKFLASFAEVAGLHVLAENQDPSRAKYEIWDVTFWEGLVLDIEMVEEPYSFKSDSGELIEGKSRQPYVRALLGKADGTAAPAQTTQAPAAASSNGKPKPTDHPKSFMEYLTAYTNAGGDPADEQAQQAFWKAENEKASAGA